jgi:predicted O-linked N-acetylglucosamine transferase (SPINDLY family)
LVWYYQLPYKGKQPVSQGTTLVPQDNIIFNAYKFSINSAVFEDKDLLINQYIELEPNLEFCDTVSNIDILQNDKFKINTLVQDILNIETNEQSKINNIVVFDIFQRKILEEKFYDAKQIDMSMFPAGLYYLNINKSIYKILKL